MKAMYYVFPVAVTLLIIGFYSCAPSDTGPEIPLGQQFRLQYDQTIRLQDGTGVTFLELRKDTRCPEDALCAHDGEAIIAIMLETGNGSMSVLELTIPGLVDQYSRTRHISKNYLGYEFTLLQLDPYPLVDHSEIKQRYVATLIIDENGEDQGN